MTTQRFDPATDTLGWWRNQIQLHPPQSPEVGRAMDSVRCWFRSLGEMMIDTLPPGPDTTVALRALKTASMHAIGAIACNQWYWEDDGSGPPRATETCPAPRTATSNPTPLWPNGSVIVPGDPVEVVGDDGWSGVVARVDPSFSLRYPVLVKPSDHKLAPAWCTPEQLIRRGAGKAAHDAR